MARVSGSRTNVVRTPAAASATTTTNANASDTTPAASATPEAPIPSGASAATPTHPKASITGLSSMTSTFDEFAVARGSGGTFRTTGADGAVSRGYIECEAEPIANGCRLTVESFHSAPDDYMTLILMAEVLDTDSNELKTINLSVLANQVVMNPGNFRGALTIDLSYDEINTFLQERNKNLQLSPGTTNLSVMAFFNDDKGKVQHRAGGPSRGGSFRLPAAPGAANVVATRIAASSDEETPLPLDMQVAYPAALVKDIPKLKEGGNVVSRLESEYKGSADEESMNAAIKKMYGMVDKIQAGDKSEIEKLLGEDWTISTVNRYWLKDDGKNTQGKAGEGFFKGFRIDDKGLPIQDPMRDEYMDNAKMGLTANEAVMRLRHNKQATVVNVKPGAGRNDEKTQIKQRIEVGYELEAGTTTTEAGDVMRQLASKQKWSTTAFNQADKEIRKLDDTLDLSQCLDPLFKVVQDRHKFTVKNEKTGVEIEFSFDIVEATTLRPEHRDAEGNARSVRYFVLEGELDHLQLGSSNSSNFAAADASSGSFTTDDAQDKWLQGTGDNVTLDIDPRLHELEDLENDAFRKTGSYKAFEGVNKKLISTLFPDRLGPAKQKAAHAAMLFGLDPLTQESCVGYVRNTMRESGIKWTDELAGLVTAHAESEELREKILDIVHLKLPAVEFSQRLLGVAAPELEYDSARLIKRFQEAMKPYGLSMNAGTKAIIKALKVSEVSPREIDTMISRFSYQSEKVIFANLAAKANVPSAMPDFDLQSTKPAIEKALSDAMIDKAILPKLSDWLESTVKGGATAFEIREQLKNLGWISKSSDALTDLKKYTRKKVPNFNVDSAMYIDAMAVDLVKDFVIVDDDLRTAMTKALGKKSMDEAKTILRQQTNDGVKALFKPKSPKLKFDIDGFHKAMAKEVPAELIYDQGIKDLLEYALKEFESLSKVKRMASFLNSMTLEEAIGQASVSSLKEKKLPTLKFDHSVYMPNFVKESSVEYVVLDAATQKALTAMVDEGGHTPKSLKDAVKAFARDPSIDFSERWPGVKKHVALEINQKKWMKELKAANKKEWNDEIATFFEKAMPLAFDAKKAAEGKTIAPPALDLKKAVEALAEHTSVKAPKLSSED